MMMLPVSPGKGRSGSRDGFVVVAALWILAALAALAAVVSIYLAQSAKALTTLDAALQSDMLTSAGLELAAYQLSASTSSVRRPTRGQFRFSLAKTNINVEYLSEAARINLNLAPKVMLVGLFSALGAGPEEAKLYAERVVGWRSSPKPNGLDVEAGLYAAAKVGYLPRQAAFESADELWLVLGLPAAIVERMLPFVTVYSGMPEVNVLDAAPTVIAALPDMTPNRLEAFLGQRESLAQEPEVVMEALGGKQLGAGLLGSDAYRVRIRFVLPNGRQRESEGVILLGSGEQAFRVLVWRDDL